MTNNGNVILERGLSGRFISAVDGYTLDYVGRPYYNSKKRRRYFGRDLQPGEIGCLLSHRKIYKKIVDEDIETALILEDDVVFEREIREILKLLMTPAVSWDVLRFLGSEKIYKRGCRIIAPLTGKYSYARLPTTPGGGHAYLVTRHAADILLKHTASNWVPIDVLLGRMWETGLETLVLHPAPVYTDVRAGSTIGDKRFDKTNRLTGMEKRFYPLFRCWYRITETLGKRYIYWSAWPRDRIRLRHHR